LKYFTLINLFSDSDQFQLGTLSHAINIKVNGYKNLPDFPTVAPDPTVRNVPIPVKEEIAQSGTKSGGSSKTAKISSQSSNNKDLEENFYSNDDEDNKSVSTGYSFVFVTIISK
jgi:AP-3 complex subunit beta